MAADEEYRQHTQGGAVYVHLLGGQAATIELPDLAGKIKSATVLGGGEIKFTQADGKLTLTVPAAWREANDTVVKLQLEDSAMALPVLKIPADGNATASNVYQNDHDNFGAQQAFDGDQGTRWATDENIRQAWLAVSFAAPKTVRQVKISEAYAGRVQKFELQYRDGDDWKTIFTGTALGENFHKTFPRVTAREFRLNILAATDGPTINEVELL